MSQIPTAYPTISRHTANRLIKSYNGSCFKMVQDNVIENVVAAFFSGNKPNYKNTFDRNYHNDPLAKILTKENIVTNNTMVQDSKWPAEAVKIMKEAGPRGAYRRPDASTK